MRDFLTQLLRRQNWHVDAVGDGDTALERIRSRPPHLVLSDIMLPGRDGVELLEEIRRDPATSRLPVILLTARAGAEATIGGLRTGADDYITKPFAPREVAARVRAVLRRARGTGGAPSRVVAAGLTVDPETREVTVDSMPVELSALEFDLLLALAQAPGRVYSRRQLLENVWGGDFFGDERVVDVHIRSIRRALGDDATAPRFIGTVRGVGYKFVAASEVDR